MAPAEWTEGWERTHETVSDYDNNQPGYITSNWDPGSGPGPGRGNCQICF